MNFNEIDQVKASEKMPKKKGGRKDHPYKGRLVGEDSAHEPDPTGYQHDLLTMPPHTLVIDTAGDLDWYKLGQHFARLNQQDPHEWGQGDSDMVITLANQEQVDRVKAILDRFGAKYKDIGGSSEHPEVHVKEFKIEKPNPKDTLNIKRKDMPQVASKDYDELFDYLKQNGAHFKKEIVPARSLKAIQGEFSDKGIETQIQKNIDMGVGKKPLIASKDNYIIDGHHRWLAAINTGANLHIIRVDISARQLLDLVKKFPKTTYKDIHENLNEGYKLQLERDDDMYILHILDTETNKRTEVRGKPDYETTGYDANDKLHQLLDKLGKSANFAELINGEVVTINPKHPHAAKANAATDVAFNEGAYDSITFKQKRQQLNVPYLIQKGAIYITDPHGPDGWEPDSEGFSLLTLYNVKGGGWQGEAKQHLKPSEYANAAKMINAPLPASGNNHLVYDGKYNQILWSIKKLGLGKEAFLGNVNETAGVGRVVKGVNTTVDVGPNEIINQVKKYGNDVDRDGKPKLNLK
jgi:hypothetical protein